MPSPARLMHAGLAFAASEMAVAVALLIFAGPQQVSAMLGIAALVTSVVVVSARPLLTPPEGGSDGSGGGTPAEPPEPPWWPEFERDLREWERERSHQRA